MEYRLSVNGEWRNVEVADDTPLLWVLRDALELVGTRFGCGAGLCGACTVHLDGEAVRSCSIPVSQVGDRPITTIEGLHPDGTHPVQRAWVEIDVPQCGYCQSGQIMAAAAFLARNPTPDDEAINGALSGNLCRCGTYGRIRSAVKRAAQEGR